MKKTVLFWSLAFIITIASAVYQRVTGPTYPQSGSLPSWYGKTINYKFERSHTTSSNYLIEINTGDENIGGSLHWRHYNTNEEYSTIEMTGGKTLKAELPAQKRLVKLEYYVTLYKKDTTNVTAVIPAEPIVIRFKDDVPIAVLIPHVFFMFFAMMISTRTGLEYWGEGKNLTKLATWTLIVLFIGGFALGFAMNGYAFGDIWGGWPFGTDVTDNKTQVAFIGWLIAFFMIKKNKSPKLAVLLAALLLLAVYMIPHSL